jgi:hypothetical protein
VRFRDRDPGSLADAERSVWRRSLGRRPAQEDARRADNRSKITRGSARASRLRQGGATKWGHLYGAKLEAPPPGYLPPMGEEGITARSPSASTPRMPVSSTSSPSPPSPPTMQPTRDDPRWLRLGTASSISVLALFRRRASPVTNWPHDLALYPRSLSARGPRKSLILIIYDESLLSTEKLFGTLLQHYGN